MSTVDSNRTGAAGQVRGVASGADAGLDSTYKIRFPRERKTLSRVAERYYLQAAARRLLPADRLAKCNRAIVPNKSSVHVKHVPQKNAAYYCNIMRCERVWTCPVCAARISENRRKELNEALSHSEQFFVVMATFTVSHHAGQSLREVLALLHKSFKRFTSGRAIQSLKETHEIGGMVKALEVTHGKNGWHPHLHVLLFCRWGGDLALLPEAEHYRYLDQRVGLLELDFWERWRHIVENLGGEVSPDAFDVRGTNDAVADYVAKFGRLPSEVRPSSYTWGPADEVTKAVVKRARGENRSPFQLLADYAEGDDRAGQLFQEYAAVMKGKRQLRWSPGLRDELGIGVEKTLDELVTDDDLLADTLAELDFDQWRVVLKNNARGRLLDVVIASNGDLTTLYDFLDALPGMEDTSLHYIQSVRASAAMQGFSQEREGKRRKSGVVEPQKGGGADGEKKARV